MSEVEAFALEEGRLRELPLPAPEREFHEVFDELPLGVYSALHAFPGARFFRLEQHIERTRRSIELLGWDFVLDEAGLRRALDAIARRRPGVLPRVRFDVLEGPATALGSESRLVLASAPWSPPPSQWRRRGIAVEVARGLLRVDPIVKRADFVLRRRPFQRAHGRAGDLLLLDREERVLECASANFYAVRDGVLETAAAGVLEGITRRAVLELAESLGIPIRFEPPPLAERDTWEEALLSSSLRHVLPITAIEGRPVAHGVPGPVTRRLMAAFEDLAHREARPAL